ncbi:MAG: glutaredoxin family protein [Gallionellaceae bacterium]|nr:MAG: glutaredoxin family protein [Gallionellaceae bacterium]
MKIGLGLTVLLLLAGNVQAEEYYRSIENTGKVHYGDKPLTNAADVEKLKPKSEPAPNDALPFETNRAKEKFPVTLYVADGCGDACALARDYLNKRGIPYTEINLVTVDEMDAFKKASGGDQIPVMTVGKDNWIKGYLESLWRQELDKAGYPKTAPYRPRPAIKPASAAETPRSE